MTELNHLWKIKFKGKEPKYVVTADDDFNMAVEKTIIGLFGDQKTFKGLEPEHPIEKIEHLGKVIT